MSPDQKGPTALHPKVDIWALKRDAPIAEVVARYGVVLRPSGQALIGRCPFHLDQGRPNLYVYPDRARWRRYRCGVGGDVISFVERLEGLDFPQAVERLGGRSSSLQAAATAPYQQRPVLKLAPAAPEPACDPAELACLEMATALYHQQLWATPRALRYLARRGLSRAVLRDCQVGFAQGGTLVPILRQHALAPEAARNIGLLRPNGREALADRIVVPELRNGHPIWMIGRLLDAPLRRPKYLGLPGRKPLLGGELARSGASAILTEGVFDWLVLCQWGYPALALLGTYASPGALQELQRCSRLFLALDRDPAGQQATARLGQLLGDRAVPITLPPDVQDVADLGTRPDGRARFACALTRMEQPVAA